MPKCLSLFAWLAAWLFASTSSCLAAGIDHRLNFDQSGIWKHSNQQVLLDTLIAGEVAGALWEGGDTELGRTFWQAIDASAIGAVSAEGLSQFDTLFAKTGAEVLAIAQKFVPQLHTYFSQPELPEENESLRERLRKAGGYFSSKLNSEFLAKVRHIDLVTDDKAVLKRARQYLQNLEKEVLMKHACFMACQTGFSASGYLRAKTDAELNFREDKDVRSSAAEVPKDTPHPDLYTRLLEWRAVMAEELDRALHEVLPTRSLQELVRLLPMDRASLKKILGIGKGKLNRFGADYRHCREI